MVCILKNQYKTELAELTKIVGSEDAAYYLLCANNGFPLNQTPTGEDSALYSELMNMYGDKEKALLAKAQAYLPEMGNWQEDPESSELDLDRNNEPSVKYLSNPDPNDPLNVVNAWTAEDISRILQDEGKLNQTLNILRDNNILDRTEAIDQAIKSGRDSFISKYIQELSKYEDITPVMKYLHSQDARRVWDERTLEKIIDLIQERLGEAFHLKKVKKGFYTYMEGDENSSTGKLKILIVNNISKYIKEAPEGTKGAYSEDINHLMSTLYISLKDGDHTTIVHELLHRYIRNYWETQPVQDALKVAEKRKFKGDPIKIEEALIEKIMNLLDTDAKENRKFWDKMNNMLNSLFSSYSNKKEILDDLTAYFSINKDLSDLTAETIFYQKIYEPVFQTISTAKEQDLMQSIKKSVKTRLVALSHERIRDNKVIADMRALDLDLEKLQSDNPDDVEQAVRSIITACKDELYNVAIIFGNVELHGIENLDIRLFAALRSNTLGFYRNIIDSQMNGLFTNTQSHQEFKPNSQLHRYVNSVSADLIVFLKKYDEVAAKWSDWFIDTKADELVTFADKEIWKHNAKKWLRSEINNGGIKRINLYFGAINSESPIVNIIDHLVRRANNRIRPLVNERGHELVKMFDDYTLHLDAGIVPINFFRDFCEHSFKRDASGRRGLTGNFRRSENWGEMQQAIDKEKVRIAKSLGIEEALDENLRLDWRAITEDLYKQFYDALDDFYEANDIIRLYVPDYYRTLRRYLSRDTIEYRKEIRELINLLETKCKNQKTDIVEVFKLNPEERQKLKDLKNLLQELSNPYNIIQDLDGKIISIEEKDPDSVEGRMAKELIEFRNAVRDKVLYYPDWDLYNYHIAVLSNNGAKNWQLAMFSQYNTMYKVTAGTFDAGRPRDKDRAMLYAKRQAIINAVKPQKGYFQQNLDLLSDEAWAELKDIDLEIADLERDILKSGGTLEAGSIDPDARVNRMQVLHYDNGVILQNPAVYQLNYLWEHEVLLMLSINPNAEFDFMQKYYYWEHKKDLITGEWQDVQTPLNAFYTMVVGNPDFTANEPIGRYTYPTGSYVESEFTRGSSAYVQPRPNGRWHDAEFERLYYGDNVYGAKHKKKTRYAKLYDLFIQTMGEIYLNYGMVDTNKYQLPGIRDDGSRTFYRRGFWTGLNWKEMMGINEQDDLYNEETQTRPDGTVIHTIPMRWVRKLTNPNLTSTDLIKTVTMMYEASLNFKEKSEIAPVIDTLLIPMGMGFFNPSDALINDLAEFIRLYKEQFVYGRTRTLGKHEKAWVSKAANTVMHKTHSKLMAHKWKVVLKNAFDSFWNFMSEVSGGKYFNWLDTTVGGAYIVGDLLQFWKRNVGVTNVRTLSAAIMQRNGISGSTEELFRGQRSSAIRRFIAKHFNMGEYTLVDYAFKGLVAMSVYHHWRLMKNPLTNKNEFMNQELAAYSYAKAGLPENEGIKIWKKAGRFWRKDSVTMLNAVYVDKKGNLKIKDEYLDIIQPLNSKGERTNLLETRIETIITERCGIINGVLPSMDRPYLLTLTLGAMIGLMRGWGFVQSADNYKTAHQFRVAAGDLDKFGLTANEGKNFFEDEKFVGLANLSSGYMERGKMLNLLLAYGRCLAAITLMNRVFGIKRPTRQLKYQTKAVTVSLIAMAAVIAIGVVFGKMVEDDPDNLTYQFLYAVNTGTMSERVSQLPFGIFISMLELIRSIVVAKSYYDDFGSIVNVIVDAGQWYAYQHGAINTEPYRSIEKRGGYQGEEKWFKDLSKATSIIIPEYSWNNIYSNFSKGAYISTLNFYNNQFPVSWLNYLPDRGGNKTNITTEIMRDNDGDIITGAKEGLENAIEGAFNFANSPF